MTALVWIAVLIAGTCFSHRAGRLFDLRRYDVRRAPGPWWRW